MNREEAIEILISVAVCDRPILSCDFCARYAGIGTHCNYPTDEEIEEAVLLLKGASKDMAISAIRQQEHFREVTKKVEPLTMDELRQMDGEPVWVEFQDGSGGCWGLVHITMFNHVVFASGLYCTVGKPYYGKTWLAYRQKPEGDNAKVC